MTGASLGRNGTEIRTECLATISPDFDPAGLWMPKSQARESAVNLIDDGWILQLMQLKEVLESKPGIA